MELIAPLSCGISSQNTTPLLVFWIPYLRVVQFHVILRTI